MSEKSLGLRHALVLSWSDRALRRKLIGSLGVVAFAGATVGVGLGVTLAESSPLKMRADATYQKARQNQAREAQFVQFLEHALNKIAAGDPSVVEAFDDGSLDKLIAEAKNRGADSPRSDEKAAVNFLLALPSDEARKAFAQQPPVLKSRTDFGRTTSTLDAISHIEFELALDDGPAVSVIVGAQSADPGAELRIYSPELLTSVMPRLEATPTNNHRAQALSAWPLSAPQNTFIAQPRR